MPKMESLTRTELLLSMIDPSGVGLEIGPGYNPLLPKSLGYQVETLDHATAEVIREKYRDNPSVDISRIEEVDFVSDGRSIAKMVGKPGHYDYIVASHVIEHTTDMLGFLKDCQTLLKKTGNLVLAVPDKRRCFDLLQSLTSTGMILQAHQERRTRHPASILFDDIAYNVLRAGVGGWAAGCDGALSFVGDLTAARNRYEYARTSSDYVDVHAWRFTPSSFRLIMHDLYAIGMLELRERAFYGSDVTEFYVSLSRDGSGYPYERLALARSIIAEQQEIILSAVDQPNASGAVIFTGTKFVTATALIPGTSIFEVIDAPPGNLVNVSVQMVNFAVQPAKYPINWKVEVGGGGSTRQLASGIIEANTAQDWKYKDLPIPQTLLSRSGKLRIQLSVATDAAAGPPAGLPLYTPDKGPGATLNGVVAAGALALTLQYARQ